MAVQAGDFDTNTQYLRSILAGLTGVGLNYKGKAVSSGIGAAEELTIPADSLVVVLTCTGEGYIELNGDATVASPVYISELTIPKLDLGSVTKLSVWPVSGRIGGVFFG